MKSNSLGSVLNPFFSDSECKRKLVYSVSQTTQMATRGKLYLGKLFIFEVVCCCECSSVLYGSEGALPPPHS